MTTLLDAVSAVLPPAASPADAPAMAAYMKHHFDFLGIRSPQLKAVLRPVFAAYRPPDESDLRDFALGCWEQPYREYQYAACAYLRTHVKVAGPSFLPVVRTLIVEKSWWDTVDTLAAHVVGPLVSRHPSLVATMDEWVFGSELWLIRTAILHQLGYRADTDAERLFGYCAAQAGHPDFFIRKGIGWALRQYAYVDPAAVASFVAATPLSPLSRREALKHAAEAA
ncbi:3-methyladenine DNA glycosylase AlkD [Allocatelliglobosispora scoriae]|uniref:3-methyladenine DNA glycosylase AlkD n=1 Tax=Allocatelliglobosispora scoriae TaxID=643052 RepID=A0A841BR36_9ACTN|nr:DNA alkylation repair protein [Allocatelliglobosispora scoriae]MBB5869212.1 3-methyladenine DNA glycosylase AlkD [Allocatelliglobosispora scoriae]